MRLFILAVVCLAWGNLCSSATGEAAASENQSESSALSPTALAISADGKQLAIACSTANKVLVWDVQSRTLRRSINLPGPPSGLAMSRISQRLYVSCAAPKSQICFFDLSTGESLGTIAAGHTAMAPVLSPNEQTLYICNRFNNEVAFIDLLTLQTKKRVAVPREPVAAGLSHDGKLLFVANHLHAGRADVDFVAASVSVIDTGTGQIAAEIALPNGSGQLRDVSISPEGDLVCVTHLLSHYHLPTTQVDRGWINCNAFTLIDLRQKKPLNTILLDEIDHGAGNPWAAAWSTDAKFLFITHAGTHEVSRIDVTGLSEKLDQAAPQNQRNSSAWPSSPPKSVSNDLAFLVGLRERIKLPDGDRGPRAVILSGAKGYVANYFSDTLTELDLSKPSTKTESIALGCQQPMTSVRWGESLFNDATLCFQEWQSCASCHSADARVDGLNWDNLHDGIGNPKNVKSLLLAHRTPPSMSLATREDAEFSVRAGLRHILFAVRPEKEAAAIDEYLKSLQPIPSPYLVDGKPSPAATRGKLLFFDETVGCADCHKPPLFTNLKSYDVGTIGKFDQPSDRFDTPTLIELWRTAPYLHDGRAVTVKEAVTHWNQGDKRGKTSHLSDQQLDDLTAYLLSL